MLEQFLINKQSHNEQLVSAAECFEKLTDQEKERLLNNRTEIVFEKGETIIKQGFIASHILFLETGMAKLDILNDNRLSTVSIIPPQSFIGIICSFASKHLDFSSTALERSTISLINMNTFEDLVKQNGEFACSVIKHMSAITNKLVHHISRFGTKNIDGALSILLLDFAKVYGSDSFVLPITRKEMASMLNYSKESVIHTLSKFNKEQIIEVSEKHIKLIDRAKLEQISITG